MITVTQHDKNEWARMAQTAYASGRAAVGHRFSAAAALPANTPIAVAQFDALQADYRAWLVFGHWPLTPDQRDGGARFEYAANPGLDY